MKKIKTFATIFLTIALAKFSSAQIYMTNLGNVSIGSTYAPPGSTNAIGLMVTGDALFLAQASGSTPAVTPGTLGSNSAPFIFGGGGSAYSSPSQTDYSWWYDGGTGMYHPASNTIGFATAGTNILTLSLGEASFSSSLGSGSIGVNCNLSSASCAAWNIHCSQSGFNKNTFYVYGTGAMWCTSTNTISDARLKENINTITNPLDKVMQLRGVTYTFISDRESATSSGTTPKTQMGVIAQEVEKVIPEVVNTGMDGYKGVQYQNLVGLLIEAVKAEKLSIDSLKNQLNNCCAAAQATSAENFNSLPAAVLYQNVPNPFSQNTTISCIIPTNATTHNLMIFNMNGGLVKTLPIDGIGNQSIVINGSSLSAGMYYYTLVVDGKEVDTKKMILTQ